jgi:hypothetical protein
MSMTITVPLNAKLANLLTQQAESKGVNVEQAALDVLERAIELPSIGAPPTTNGTNGELTQPTITVPHKPVPQVRRSTRGVTDRSKLNEWLRQNRDKYRGQWVVLDEDRLVGHATTAAEATAFVEQARAEGVRSPFIQKIPLDDEPIWMMWL